MAIFTPIDLYQIIYDIANSMPATYIGGVEKKCSRLQTAAHVKDYGVEVKTDNLGKDVRYQNKKIFFSRSWNNTGQDPNKLCWDYPALFYGEGQESGEPQKKGLTITYTFALSDRCEQTQLYTLNQNACEARTYEEVNQNLRSMWQSIHRTLLDYVYARLYMGPTQIADGWYSKTAIKELITSGAITSYKEDFYLATYVSHKYTSRVVWDMQTENCVTHFAELEICFSECAPIIISQPQENIPTPPAYDQETIDYADKTGITDKTILDAIDQHYVKGGKADGWLAKCIAFWPMVGGTAYTHSINMVAPTGLPADYTLQFFNSWVHDANGIKGNGIDTYASTFFVPKLHAPATNLTIGCGIASTESGPYIDMGCNGNSSGSNNGQTFIAPSLSGIQYRACNSTGNNTGTGLNPLGLHATTRDGALAVKTFKDGVLVATDSQPNTTSDYSVYLGARSNNGPANAITPRRYDLGFICTSFTDADHIAMYNRYIAFKAQIGR